MKQHDRDHVLNIIAKIQPDIDYVSYKSNMLTARCPIHGVFKRKLSECTRGTICPSCGIARRSESTRLSDDEVRRRASLCKDIDNNDILSIYNGELTAVCSLHGKYSRHISKIGYGYLCPKCGIASNCLTNHQFIEKASLIHPGIDFSKVNYINTLTPVEVSHPKYGSYLKSPLSIIAGCALPFRSGSSSSEEEILEYIKSISTLSVTTRYRPSWLGRKELDIYIDSVKFAIEYNGTAFHHSSSSQHISSFLKNTSKPALYHYNKWKMCLANDVNLLSIYDFYWNDPLRKEIYKSKIRHAIGLDTKLFARKCTISPICNNDAYEFYEKNHIEGKGFPYRNSVSYGMFFDNKLVMACTVGEIYNQSSKSFKLKLHRICTIMDVTVVGGISRLCSFLFHNHGSFDYHITLSSGGSTIKYFNNYTFLGPRYFWVNPSTLQYYHRNYCQKHLLQKHFEHTLLDSDTESSYMEKIGFVKVYDNGIVSLSYKN